MARACPPPPLDPGFDRFPPEIREIAERLRAQVDDSADVPDEEYDRRDPNIVYRLRKPARGDPDPPSY